MNENIKNEIDLKCAEIKRELGIIDSNLTEIDKKKIQPPEVLIDAAEPESSRSPRLSQSTKRSRSPTRSRSPRKVHSPERSSYRQQTLTNTFPSSSQEQKETNDLPMLSSSKSQTPLGLEQLMERHKHNADFLISWRELLKIFEIEDNQVNVHEAECITPQVLEEPTDSLVKVIDHVGVDERSMEAQESPIEAAEPTTVISVLSLLTALEDLLGSLGPKLILLLQTAIAMDKSEADSSKTLLDYDHNWILFETIKEKLKGLLTANSVEANLQNVVRKAINDMTDLVDRSIERKKNCHTQLLRTPSIEKTTPLPETEIDMEIEPCDLPVTEESNIDAENDKALPLKDSEITTLMTKFTSLSENDKWNFTTYLNRLNFTDPDRVQRLRNSVCEIPTPIQLTLPESGKEMYCPGEVFYTETPENTPCDGEDDDTLSIAYRVAKKNAGVKIKRRTRYGNGSFHMEKN